MQKEKRKGWHKHPFGLSPLETVLKRFEEVPFWIWRRSSTTKMQTLMTSFSPVGSEVLPALPLWKQSTRNNFLAQWRLACFYDSKLGERNRCLNTLMYATVGVWIMCILPVFQCVPPLPEKPKFKGYLGQHISEREGYSNLIHLLRFWSCLEAVRDGQLGSPRVCGLKHHCNLGEPQGGPNGNRLAFAELSKRNPQHINILMQKPNPKTPR